MYEVDRNVQKNEEKVSYVKKKKRDKMKKRKDLSLY